MGRIARLLRLGLLPVQLPPCFTTATLASNHAGLFASWSTIGQKPSLKAPATKAEVFSVARAGHQRRATSLPNPIAQTFLCYAIVDNWGSILKQFRKSRISASHPRFRRSESRAVSLPSMQALSDRKLLVGAGYRYVLRTDISRFFPTIYTHSIPWALHGKSVAKKNRGATKKHFGNIIDTAVRQCQDEQTFGLPIGPDTSHIIAECVATAIDLDFTRRLKTTPVGFRYVDDYYLFFETLVAAEAALAHLVRCLKEYELQINFEKTIICRIEDLQEDSWTHTLRSLSIAPDGKRQRSDANYYFEVARELARKHKDESVMVYALRRIGSIIIRVDNWPSFEAQLCLSAVAHPVTLQTVARLLSTYAGLGYPISKPRLSRLINSLLSEHAPLDHHSEVAWCLWMCKELGLTLTSANVDIVSSMDSSICNLILLDLSSQGRLPKSLPYSRYKLLENSESLREELWMLSYEAGVRGWAGMTDAHIRADPYFEELRKNGVRFYDVDAKITPLFTPRPNALQEYSVKTIAQLLKVADLELVFDYEDEEDDYGYPIEAEDDEDD